MNWRPPNSVPTTSHAIFKICRRSSAAISLPRRYFASASRTSGCARSFSVGVRMSPLLPISRIVSIARVMACGKNNRIAVIGSIPRPDPPKRVPTPREHAARRGPGTGVLLFNWMVEVAQHFMCRGSQQPFGQLDGTDKFAEHLLVPRHFRPTNCPGDQAGEAGQKAQFDGAPNDRLEGHRARKGRSHQVADFEIARSEHPFPRYQYVVENGDGVTLVEPAAQRPIKRAAPGVVRFAADELEAARRDRHRKA